MRPSPKGGKANIKLGEKGKGEKGEKEKIINSILPFSFYPFRPFPFSPHPETGYACLVRSSKHPHLGVFSLYVALRCARARCCSCFCCDFFCEAAAIASRTPKRPEAHSLRMVSVRERDDSFIFVTLVVRILYSSTIPPLPPHPRSTKEIGSFRDFYSLVGKHARDVGCCLLAVKFCRAFLEKRGNGFLMVLRFKQIIEAKSFGLHCRVEVVLRALVQGTFRDCERKRWE
jgi:hypothetical protein